MLQEESAEVSVGKQAAADLGKEAENRAEQCLRQRGYRIVARGYRCRRGEIDLIAKHQETLVFVEVRYRRDGLVSAAESIDRAKMRRIALAAQHYLAFHPTALPCRFDVVCVSKSNIEVLPGAFSLDDLF